MAKELGESALNNSYQLGGWIVRENDVGFANLMKNILDNFE